MTNPDKTIIIGRFGKTHGIKGWLRVISFTDPIENILNYSDWQCKSKNRWEPIEITDTKLHSGQILVKTKDYDTPEDVQVLVNREIGINREQLPETDDDEYYWSDLVGLSVVDQDGETLGTIDHLFATGANDVIVVNGEREIMLPYIDDVVKKVDLVAGRMIVEWSEPED